MLKGELGEPVVDKDKVLTSGDVMKLALGKQHGGRPFEGSTGLSMSRKGLATPRWQ